MIKKTVVCLCDVCGKMAAPQCVSDGYNEEAFTPPDGWTKGTVSTIDICPDCTRKLHTPDNVFRATKPGSTKA